MTNFAFVFPGQGSQAIGMLNGFAGNLVVQQTIAEASDALQFDLPRLIAEGPKEDLDLTTNTQPVMLACAVAFYRAWLAAGGKAPSIVAGHSLGEYSALVAAGADRGDQPALLVIADGRNGEPGALRHHPDRHQIVAALGLFGNHRKTLENKLDLKST